MAEYRSDLPPLPARMRQLPIDDRGFPVPWFVAWLNGKPDFRVIRPGGIAMANNKELCWLCGERRGKFAAFVVGPMCGVNRVSSEPPSHRECALYAVKACPFLTRPLAVRNEKDMPEGGTMAGIGIKRNPGATLLWVTRDYKPFRAGNGVLFKLGEPTELQVFARGRQATREEVDESIRTGLPLLEAEAKKDGPSGIKALARMHAAFVTRLDQMYSA